MRTWSSPVAPGVLYSECQARYYTFLTHDRAEIKFLPFTNPPLFPDQRSKTRRLTDVKVISNYTKKLAAMDPEANPIRGPPQPPSWKLPEGSDYPDVSDDDSESDEASPGNPNNHYSSGDRPVSLSETRKEMEEKMEKKVSQQRACTLMMTMMTEPSGAPGLMDTRAARAGGGGQNDIHSRGADFSTTARKKNRDH